MIVSAVKKLCLVLCTTVAMFGFTLPAGASSDPPVIENFQIEREKKDGRWTLVFTWSARNVDRVTLLDDGRPMEARIQLPDGSFGWPPQMPRAFRTTGTQGTYTLIAENDAGRVEARGRYDGNTCFAWRVPPGTHWSRCRKDGQIAKDLSVTVALGPPRCSVEGQVRSRLRFRAEIVDNPLNPSSGTSFETLDKVGINRVGTNSWRPLRLSGRGDMRTYRATGLKGGHDYLVVLPSGWSGQPGQVRFRCPDKPGEHMIRPKRLFNTGYHHEY